MARALTRSWPSSGTLRRHYRRGLAADRHLDREAQDRPEVQHLRRSGAGRQVPGRETYCSGRLPGRGRRQGRQRRGFRGDSRHRGRRVIRRPGLRDAEERSFGANEEWRTDLPATPEPRITGDEPGRGALIAAGEYPGSTLYPSFCSNYSVASPPASNPINKIIIHVT